MLPGLAGALGVRLSATRGLDALGGGGKGSAGILAHFGVAVNGAGRPLGAFLANADFRQDPERDSVRWTDGLDRAQGLAAACPDTRVVTICDREGDSWELLARAGDRGGGAGAGEPGREALQRFTLV